MYLEFLFLFQDCGLWLIQIHKTGKKNCYSAKSRGGDCAPSAPSFDGPVDDMDWLFLGFVVYPGASKVS